jgi:hypothetical protein
MRARRASHRAAVVPDPHTAWELLVTQAMRTCVDAFGEGEGQRITYQHAGGETYEVDGIFESATEAVDVDTGAPVLSYQPRMSFTLADLSAVPKNGDTCVIRGTRYAVVEPMFDGQGTVTLRLHKA